MRMTRRSALCRLAGAIPALAAARAFAATLDCVDEFIEFEFFHTISGLGPRLISQDEYQALSQRLAEQFADQWDQHAFDPDYPTYPLEHFEPMVREVFSRPPRRG